MSKGHQANRRRTYGRRQHEVRERRDRDQRDGTIEHETGQGSFAPVEGAVADRHSLPYGATWLGLE
jgi:hypothetical protein